MNVSFGGSGNGRQYVMLSAEFKPTGEPLGVR